jgi:hypothetical protein
MPPLVDRVVLGHEDLSEVLPAAEEGAVPGGVSPTWPTVDQVDQGVELTGGRPPSPQATGLAEAGGFPPELSWEHFQRSREEALFAPVEEETSEIERLMGDLRLVGRPLRRPDPGPARVSTRSSHKAMSSSTSMNRRMSSALPSRSTCSYTRTRSPRSARS